MLFELLSMSCFPSFNKFMMKLYLTITGSTVLSGAEEMRAKILGLPEGVHLIDEKPYFENILSSLKSFNFYCGICDELCTAKVSDSKIMSPKNVIFLNFS